LHYGCKLDNSVTHLFKWQSPMSLKPNYHSKVGFQSYVSRDLKAPI
jgi:hypothetical protein